MGNNLANDLAISSVPQSHRHRNQNHRDLFKCLFGSYKVKCTQLLKLNIALHEPGNMTCGHKVEPKNRSCNLPLRRNFFGNQIVNAWNSLLLEVVTAATVNCFKKLFGSRC